MINAAKWSGGKPSCWQKKTATVWLKILCNQREKKCHTSLVQTRLAKWDRKFLRFWLIRIHNTSRGCSRILRKQPRDTWRSSTATRFGQYGSIHQGWFCKMLRCPTTSIRKYIFSRKLRSPKMGPSMYSDRRREGSRFDL